MSAADDLKRIEREIEAKQSDAAPLPPDGKALPPAAKTRAPRNSFDLVLALAASLAIAGVGVNTVRQMPDQDAKTLRDGLIGATAGLLVGYSVGRFRP